MLPGIVIPSSSTLRGPVGAWSTVQKSLLPTLGDLPAELGDFKIVWRGLKKLLGGRRGRTS